jgi:hypothetical protein
VIYELQPPVSSGGSWTQTVVYAFGDGVGGGALAGAPSALLPGPGGSLYVAAGGGGVGVGEGGVGALDQFLPPGAPGGTWAATVAYAFSGFTGPVEPDSLTKGPNGVLLGTSYFGGTVDCGAVFELFPPSGAGGVWTESTLYSFQCFADGAAPNNVIPGPDGNLYGTTLGTLPTGNFGAATVFQLTPPASPGGTWSKTILKTFEAAEVDCGLDSPLILQNGNLYGAACLAGGGAVFELEPPSTPGGAWTYVKLHEFENHQEPGGAMVMTSNGVIYGATALPFRAPPGGTIFEIIPK